MAGLTMTDAWLLKDVEQQLVETGSATYRGQAQAFTTLLATGFLIAVATDTYDLTERGWKAALAFRRHVAANRPSGGIPPFTDPPSPDEAAEQEALARDMYARAMTATPLTPPPAAATADQCIQAAAAFVARKKAAAL
jgi:hypothetical protein